ncbi:MAG: oxidoreductase [Candidatus Riflebacteria bacterium]|nr:oxidoreductase [Candidatus Riflebacteria bacterium]
MSKPKVAFYWCASCGGCEEAVVDLAEGVLQVVDAVDICFWPCALDFKKSDVEAMADGEITACFINGAIRSSEQLEMAELVRRKSKVLVAFGSCAQQGGIPGLANLFDLKGVMETAYETTASTVNPDKTRPKTSHREGNHELTLPELWDTVHAVSQRIDVDYFIPGCPPTPKLLADAVNALLEGKLPPKGSILSPNMALCEQCPRKDSKPSDLAIKEFKRPHAHMIDPEKCLLAQGFLCMGPATRGGCESLCINGNMPCTGCFGPTDQVRDQGAKALSAIASAVGSNDEGEIENILKGIVDPVGTFYRYGLATSMLHRKKMPAKGA